MDTQQNITALLLVSRCSRFKCGALLHLTAVIRGHFAAVAVFLLIGLACENVLGQTLEWAKRAGGANLDTGEREGAVCVDSVGNSYVTGAFAGTATFGPGEANETILTSAGSRDIFVAKYDSVGDLAWAKRAGGGSLDRGFGIAVDGVGNSYVTGSFGFTADFDGIVLEVAVPGAPDLFVAKYDANGNLDWVEQIGIATGFAISVSSAGNSVVTGQISVSAAFPADIFVAKYDSTGTLQWDRQATGVENDGGLGVSLDGTGNSYVTGSFGGSVTFGAGEVNETILTSAGANDVFVAKYDSNGDLVWAKRAGGVDFVQGEGISVDSAGSSYVTGSYAGPATFGAGEVNETILAFQHLGEIFVAKFDSLGNLVWARGAIGQGIDQGFGISVDGAGSSYVTGEFAGAGVTFAPGEVNETSLVNTGFTGLEDIFVAKYDTSGNLLWVRQAGGEGREVGWGISVDGLGDSHVTGYFDNTTTFGSGEVNETTLISAGLRDIFVAKYMNDGSVDLDLDIAGFQVTKRIRLSKPKAVTIRVVVRNNGAVDGDAEARVIGVQGGNEVYNEIMVVSDLTGNGSTTFDFPGFTPVLAGDIIWTATIADVDPDLDEETAVTTVVPNKDLSDASTRVAVLQNAER